MILDNVDAVRVVKRTGVGQFQQWCKPRDNFVCMVVSI